MDSQVGGGAAPLRTCGKGEAQKGGQRYIQAPPRHPQHDHIVKILATRMVWSRIGQTITQSSKQTIKQSSKQTIKQ